MRQRPAGRVHVPQQLVATGQSKPGSDLTGQVSDQAVSRATGHRVQLVADVQQVQPGPLHHRMRYVDQPGGHQRPQYDGIPQTAVRLLEVRLGQMRELPDRGGPIAARLRPARAAASSPYDASPPSARTAAAA